MTTDLALAYITKRVCELGYGINYTMRVRHLVLQPLEERHIALHNQFMVVIEPYRNTRIESYMGVFDLSENNINELQYEHTGDVTIQNQSIFIHPVRFIQVIPNLCPSTCQ